MHLRGGEQNPRGGGFGCRNVPPRQAVPLFPLDSRLGESVSLSLEQGLATAWPGLAWPGSSCLHMSGSPAGLADLGGVPHLCLCQPHAELEGTGTTCWREREPARAAQCIGKGVWLGGPATWSESSLTNSARWEERGSHLSSPVMLTCLLICALCWGRRGRGYPLCLS